MYNISLLEKVIFEQQTTFNTKNAGTLRDINFQKYLKTRQITVIMGARRSGKSTLLRQFSAHFDSFYYINFDDERLINFTVKDFDTLLTAFRKRFQAATLFMDEVQHVPMWERFVRRIFDEDFKIFVTGSNAGLLSSEYATHLTGRYFPINLYPFSFKEYLRFHRVAYERPDSRTRAAVLTRFDEYLADGSFPEFVVTRDRDILQRIYEDILHRDLLTRFKIRDAKAFRELTQYLFSNLTSAVSYNALCNTLGFKNASSVRNYISYLEEAWLMFALYKYDWSLKKRFVSDKKIYVIDNGLRNAVAFSFSPDQGKLLENIVFLELKRRGHKVYFYKGKRECDFLIYDRGRISAAFQVAATLTPANERREREGLIEALTMAKLGEGTLLTLDHEESTVQEGGHTIVVRPVWKWLLGLE